MRLIVALVIIFFASCKVDLSNPDVKKIYDEVMYVHDEVMPETSTIHKLRKELKKLDETDSLTYALILELEQADEAMMQWMADFGTFRQMDKEKDEVKIQYLINEKEKIQTVSDDMMSAIAKAQEYLNNN